MGLYNSCERGNWKIAKMTIEKGANGFNGGLQKACVGGHADIAVKMVEHGADVNKGVVYACENGNHEITFLMFDMGATDWNCALASAENTDMQLADCILDWVYHNETKIYL